MFNGSYDVDKRIRAAGRDKVERHVARLPYAVAWGEQVAYFGFARATVTFSKRASTDSIVFLLNCSCNLNAKETDKQFFAIYFVFDPNVEISLDIPTYDTSGIETGASTTGIPRMLLRPALLGYPSLVKKYSTNLVLLIFAT